MADQHKIKFFDRIPAEVRAEIQAQYRRAVRLSEEHFVDLQGDEDSLTGGLSSQMRTIVQGEAFVGKRKYVWNTYGKNLLVAVLNQRKT